MGRKRILHVFEAASVAAVLAKYQRRAGHHSAILSPDGGGADPYDIMGFYGHRSHDTSSTYGRIRFKASLVAHACRADILHLHGYHNLAAHRSIKPLGKKIIMHHHGASLRNNPESAEKLGRLADAVLVSMPDLLEYVDGATYVPNPVDTEHFCPAGAGSGHVWRKYHIDEPFEQRCSRFGINAQDVDVIDGTPYSEMPGRFSARRTLLDFKSYDGIANPDVLSLTALQALACGLNVMDSSGTIHDGLPEKHRPENAVRMLDQIYQKVLES